jgi:carbamoyltransferase
MSEFELAFKPAIGPYGQHDPSAALFEDGGLAFAVEEERLSREKHAPNTFPERSIRACLDHRGLALSDVDEVVLPYDPTLRRNVAPHTLRSSLRRRGLSRKLDALGATARKELQAQLYPTRQIESRLSEIGTPVPPVVTRAHHRCHAASAFHPSGFDRALVVTVDAKGEYDSTVVWEGTPAGLRRVRTYDHPNSLGLFYAVVTEYLGYRMFNGEGKVMGLAPYGSDDGEIRRRLRRLVTGGVEYDVTPLTGQWGTEVGVERLEELFGRERRPEPGEFDRFEKDLAHVAQRFTEETVLDIVETYCRRLGHENVCLAGGVALNCKMNQRVAESDLVDGLFVQPVANDAGLALGAGWVDRAPASVPEQTHVYFGPEYSTSGIRDLLETNKIAYGEPDDLEAYVAERLADGALVGWFQGRLELGPRALGNRSILADPRTAESRDRVNRYVKHREEWRPFAPSMLEAATGDVLTLDREHPYMIVTSGVRPEAADEIPAVLHSADDTTRPQTVREEQNPRYYRLLREFERLTDVPVLLNTSFNDHGEPIVNTPKEALKDFYGMGLDVLVLEDVVVEKRPRSSDGEVSASVNVGTPS